MNKKMTTFLKIENCEKSVEHFEKANFVDIYCMQFPHAREWIDDRVSKKNGYFHTQFNVDYYASLSVSSFSSRSTDALMTIDDNDLIYGFPYSNV